MKASDLHELVYDASLVDLLQLLEMIGNELRARGLDPEGFQVLGASEVLRRRYYGAIRPAAEISGAEDTSVPPGKEPGGEGRAS